MMILRDGEGAEWSGFVNGYTLSVDGGWFADGPWEGLRRGKQGT